MSKIFITGGSGFIGTNLVELLVGKGHDILNFDIAPPLNSAHSKFWMHGDIMNFEFMQCQVNSFAPDILLHLAARTDTLSSVAKDYEVNTLGSQNVIAVVKSCPTIQRLVMTSTQYVYKSREQPFPSSDTIYAPHTVYGQSKVITEKVTREGNLSCDWTIVRPTNIWGPWHMRYPLELWRAIARGIYVHPGKEPIIRTYGYVKNVAHQYHEIITAPSQSINAKTFYLGDYPIDSYLWLNEFSLKLTGKRVRRVPAVGLKLLSMFGDMLKALGLRFPLHSERYKNMVEDYIAPANETIAYFGLSHPSLRENVAETINWIRTDFSKTSKFWQGYIR